MTSAGLYLRRQVEAQVTATETVLNEQRNFLGKVECYGGGEVGRLAEVDKVLKGEGQGDGFGEVDSDILIGLVDVGVLANGDGAVTDVTLAGELDALLAGLNNN